MRSFTTAMVIGVLVFACAGQAAITYVDATPNITGSDGNTTVNGALVDFTTGTGNAITITGSNNTDGKWDYRQGFANPQGTGRVWESAEPGTLAAPYPAPLVTTLTGLTPGTTYNLYGLWWSDNTTTSWNCYFRVGSTGSYTFFDKSNSTLSTATGTEFANTVLTREGGTGTSGRMLYMAVLGQTVASGTGTVEVWASRASTIARTWYDGVGYEVAVTCQTIPTVTVQRPIAPGAATVTVNGVSPIAQSVNVYVGGTTLVGTAAGSPPNTPSSVPVTINTTLKFGDMVSARQVVGGLEDCAPNTSVGVATPRITYVDAAANTNGTDGNTTLNGALVDFTPGSGNVTTDAGSDSGTDGLWHVRTTFANAAAIWESNEPSLLTPLVTTLALTPGTYNLYGLTWTDVGTAFGTWDVGFRVGATGSYTTYGLGSMASATAGGDEFVNTVMTREQNRWLMIASLGQYTVTGPVDVYVIAPPGASARTWYDGVGYELVTPAVPLPVADGFGDGDRNNDGLLDDPDGSGGGIVDSAGDVGLKWLRVFLSSTENQTLRVAHDLAAPGGLGDDNVLQVNVTGNQAYQVAGFPPTLLVEPRDFIRLSAQVRFTTMVDSRDTLRFGLFGDGAKSIAVDEPTPAIIQHGYGYYATVATGTVGATARIGSNYPWGADGSIFGLDSNVATQTPFAHMINDNLPHTVSLTVIRGFGGYALFTYTVDGSTALEGVDSSTPAFFFNEIGFGSVPNPGISYDLDDLLIEKGAVAVCEAIPPVTPEALIPGDTTTTVVNGVVPEAEQVNVYVDGNLIGTATGSPPNTPASVTVTLSQPPVSGTVTAKQVVNGVESCRPPTGVPVNDCNAVPAVSIQDDLVAGDTTVIVAGIDATATAVSVYANGTTLLGTVATDGSSTTAVVPVTPLPRDAHISATQTIRGVQSCIPTGLLVFNAKLTYVDAVPNTTGTDGNTTINGALVNTGADGNATTAATGQTAAQATDGLWHVRLRSSETSAGGSVNGAGVWETDTAGTENTAALVTRLALTPGTYDLYGILWNNSDNAGVWDASFRVGPTGAFTLFDKSNAILARANASEFANTALTRDGNSTTKQMLLIAPLGRYSVAGPVDIYVNGEGATDTRTWYDGIAYVVACNDPAADMDSDGDVDQADFAMFQNCYTGDGFSGTLTGSCYCLDRVSDGSISSADLLFFVSCWSGPAVPANLGCDD